MKLARSLIRKSCLFLLKLLIALESFFFVNHQWWRDLPRTFIFYDDAQNLYGRRRPTWLDIGLDMRGRSIVMDKSFRNSRQIIEPAFNVLLGTHAADPQSVKTRGFADVAALKDANLIAVDQSGIRVNFAAREGDPVVLTSCESREQEEALLAKRCEHLLKIDKLLPQDIFILTFRRARAFELAAAIAKRIGSEFVRCALREKDSLAIQADKVTVSTIASAKGYDAPCV